jgi:hypothetical protein
MAYFPQLVTGALVQYPMVKRRRNRVIINESLDGSTLKLDDADWATIAWELAVAGLTDAEWAAIESLFHTCEGRLGKFTFLDPTDNLLAWSEDLSASVWVKGPMLQLVQGVDDPLGETNAVRVTNISQTSQDITQTVSAPGNFHYCFSLYARSPQETAITLLMQAGSISGATSCAISSNWNRLIASANLQSMEESVRFGLTIQAGEIVEVFGMQAEPQLAPSKYKKTLSRGGVYPNAHFADDSLTLITEGPEQHSSMIRIVSTLKD